MKKIIISMLFVMQANACYVPFLCPIISLSRQFLKDNSAGLGSFIEFVPEVVTLGLSIWAANGAKQWTKNIELKENLTFIAEPLAAIEEALDNKNDGVPGAKDIHIAYDNYKIVGWLLTRYQEHHARSETSACAKIQGLLFKCVKKEGQKALFWQVIQKYSLPLEFRQTLFSTFVQKATVLKENQPQHYIQLLHNFSNAALKGETNKEIIDNVNNITKQYSEDAAGARRLNTLQRRWFH